MKQWSIETLNSPRASITLQLPLYESCAQVVDRMGWIQTAYLLCTRITPETTALRVMWLDREKSALHQDYRSASHISYASALL